MFRTNRRSFLGASAAVGALALGGKSGRAADKPLLQLDIIGVGGYGMVNARAALRCGGTQIVGVCDVDSGHLEKSADELEKLQGKRPRTFKLYDQLLDAVATHRVADRPDRFEPRQRKRRQKKYDRMMKPRHELKREMLQRVT